MFDHRNDRQYKHPSKPGLEEGGKFARGYRNLQAKIYALSLGSNSSAFSRSMPRSSVSVNPPFSIRPLLTAAPDPPPSGKSVPNKMWDDGTSFLNDGNVYGLKACAVS